MVDSFFFSLPPTFLGKNDWWSNLLSNHKIAKTKNTMRNEECVLFLQWALPQLNLRWKGFRRVRQQVCKRIQRRLKELELPDFNAYRFYLKTHPEEWLVLDSYCQITISRFYRDRDVFN